MDYGLRMKVTVDNKENIKITLQTPYFLNNGWSYCSKYLLQKRANIQGKHLFKISFRDSYFEKSPTERRAVKACNQDGFYMT